MTPDSFTIHVDTQRRRGLVGRSDGSSRELSADEISVAASIADARGAEFSLHAPSPVAAATLDEAHQVRPIPRAGTFHASSPFIRGGAEIPLGHLALRSGMTFDDVLASRRSRRSLASLDLRSLAYVLTSARRVQGWRDSDDGSQMTHCAVPSAGGRQPTELVVLIESVTDAKAGLWWFDAVRCTLVEQSTDHDVAQASEAVAAAARIDGTAPAIIFVVAHLQRTVSRYPAGSTLVWRDVGAMLATLHLTATAAGLASCIVGTSGVLIRDQEALVADVGALVVGSSVP